MYLMTTPQLEPVKNRYQITSQIFFPFLFLLIIIGICAYFLFSGIALEKLNGRVWADISILVILLPFMMMFPILLAILVINIFFLSLIREKIENLFLKIHPLVQKVSKFNANLLGALTKPIILVNSWCSILANFLGKKEKD